MSEFEGFFEDFSDGWTTTAAFYKRTSAGVDDDTGIPTPETDTLLGTVSVGFWTSNSQETNVNDKFVNQKIGEMVVNKSELTFTIDTESFAVINGENYYIEGTDNIGLQGEVLLLTWRKEYKA